MHCLFHLKPRNRYGVHIALLICLLFYSAFSAAQMAAGAIGNAVLWTDPGDISSRNLYWGLGDEKHKPQLPVEFEQEDRHGTYPKFDVRDSKGTKWRVKLGIEAQPEVVASRLLWAVGYNVNENYLLPQLHVNKLPPHLHRGRKLVHNGGDLSNVRLQRRRHEKRTGNWNWQHNPFVGTREFNGLRVMMAFLRNWDLYDLNNAVLEDESHPWRTLFEVSDLGTGLGGTGLRLRDKNCKNSLKLYRRGRLISRIKPDFVDLSSPAHPSPWFVFELPFYLTEFHAHRVSRRIPRSDARWIGSLLSQLSFGQICDAFRAGGYSPEQAKAFADVLTVRIQELGRL